MIYLNSASTTKPDKKVLDDFMWCAEHVWHNPSDISRDAMDSRNIIKTAQNQIAKVINAEPEEIVFTSGGSESNNWAIKGYTDYYNIDLILSTEIEHPSVYNTCLFCKERGTKLIYIPVDNFGIVDLQYLEKMMKIHSEGGCKILVSIIFANNEIGTVQPIKKIAEIVHKYNGALHCDAVQAFMHTQIDVKELGIDMMSASFHKFGGFKNCGFLYIKDGIELTPLIHGGHQFDSRRAGTENVPMIYAMGNQVERLNDDLDVHIKRTKGIQDYMIQEIYEKCGEYCNIYLNGHPDKRIANNLNFTFEGINASALISLLEAQEIYVSAGSACCAGSNTPSKVLQAIGLSDEETFNTIRISFDDKLTKDEVDQFVDALVECIKSLHIFI